METKLCAKEILLYFFLWVSANFYSLHKLYNVQTEILTEHSNITFKELRPGWTVISKLKDYSDFEWSTWTFFFFSSWHYLIFHFLVSEFLRSVLISVLPYWYILASIVYISTVFGMKQVLAVIIQPIIFGSITFSGGKKPAIWMTCVAILLSVNSLKQSIAFWNFFDHNNLKDEEINLLIIGLGWAELRCLSYCINLIDLREKEKIDCHKHVNKNIFNDFIKLMSYVLYLPTLYTGPIILYEDFEKTFVHKNVSTTMKLRAFLKNITFYLIYTLILELAFHYIYFLAMQEHIELIRKMPSMALCGGGLWMGLQFHMKYVVSYGTAGAFASLDNIDPPPTPRCIARIHVYSHMWRYFDVGLYRFLIKYIYIPAITTMREKMKLSKLQAKQIASFITYIFIFIWHETTLSIFIWSLLNYIGITLEQLGSIIIETDSYKYFKNNILKSDQMELRFKAIICAPLFAMSAISSFYLFAGYEIGNLFFEYSMQPSFWNCIIISVALYSCCQVSMFLKDVPSRTDTKFTKAI